MSELITEESAKVLHEVRSFLEETVTEIIIVNESQKVNATTLGNELQKKYSLIEATRKKEKNVWDAKAKEVQNEFLPTLNAITDKKNALGRALTEYNRKLQIEIQKRQAELEAESQKERDRLERLAGTREEKAILYREKAATCRERIKLMSGDPIAYGQLCKELIFFENKEREFLAKIEATQEQVAQVVTPVYVPETRTADKGTRRRMVATVSIVNMKDFAAWCISHDEAQFLLIDETKLKKRIVEKEGNFAPLGLSCSYQEETGFSGR
jgi:hypothetical protein